VRIVVEAPARLHLGFIDLNGQCGRMFGSLGVALERPRYVLEAGSTDRPDVGGDVDEDLRGTAGDLRRQLDLRAGVVLRVLESIPPHVGFGSGTQRRLALAFAISKLAGRGLSVAELATLAGRGRRSGIGIAAFDKGGFVVDAGRPNGSRPDRGPGDGELPLVIFQHAVPADWFFVVVVPRDARGLSGRREEQTFVDLPLMGEDTVGRISRLTLMKVIPGVITDDIRGFGEALAEIQTLVGEHFAPYQGGVYATTTGRDAATFAMKRGAYGVGQSSWGPAVFAIVRGEDHAGALACELRESLGAGCALVFSTRANNRGSAWRRLD